MLKCAEIIVRVGSLGYYRLGTRLEPLTAAKPIQISLSPESIWTQPTGATPGKRSTPPEVSEWLIVEEKGQTVWQAIEQATSIVRRLAKEVGGDEAPLSEVNQQALKQAEYEIMRHFSDFYRMQMVRARDHAFGLSATEGGGRFFWELDYTNDAFGASIGKNLAGDRRLRSVGKLSANDHPHLFQGDFLATFHMDNGGTERPIPVYLILQKSRGRHYLRLICPDAGEAKSLYSDISENLIRRSPVASTRTLETRVRTIPSRDHLQTLSRMITTFVARREGSLSESRRLNLDQSIRIQISTALRRAALIHFYRNHVHDGSSLSLRVIRELEAGRHDLGNVSDLRRYLLAQSGWLRNRNSLLSRLGSALQNHSGHHKFSAKSDLVLQIDTQIEVKLSNGWTAEYQIRGNGTVGIGHQIIDPSYRVVVGPIAEAQRIAEPSAIDACMRDFAFLYPFMMESIPKN